MQPKFLLFSSMQSNTPLFSSLKKYCNIFLHVGVPHDAVNRGPLLRMLAHHGFYEITEFSAVLFRQGRHLNPEMFVHEFVSMCNMH